MAVFTEVSPADAQGLLDTLQLGELVALKGIQGGIENTNYFVTSQRDGATQEWVLTLFERLSHEQLPFYLGLMHHLAQHGVSVPDPMADAQGQYLHTVCGKPAALVNKLSGTSQLQPQSAHCAAMGEMLARMHLAARDYPGEQANLRALSWWQAVVPDILPHLDAAQAELLQAELAFQTHLHASSTYVALPRGPVHADVFRDNVMFEGETLTGVFDFYFAGVDTWLFDLCVCINDEKMSKSLGNFFTIRDVLQTVDAETLRFFIVRAHYRSALNYGVEHLKDARTGLRRLYTALSQVAPEPVVLDWQANAHAQAFARAMNEDFGTPAAVAVLFELAAEVNRSGSAQAAGWLRALGGVLGLLQDDPQAYLQRGASDQALSAEHIQAQIAERAAAKQAKDYARADAIRHALAEQGVTLKDSPQGTTWERL